MNTTIKKLIGMVSLLLIVSSTAIAQELERGRDGTLACGGSHGFRNGNTEITFTNYLFRNFNERTTITIESITLYSADGMVVSDMPYPNPFPSGFDNVLDPNQTAQLSTRDIFGDSPATAPPSNQLQAIVKWTADARGLLQCVTIR